MLSNVKIGGFFHFRCYNPDGSLAWQELNVPVVEAKNLVPNGGLDHVLSVVLGAGTQVATWYAGLIDNSGFSAVNASDTMSSHSGWAESTAYTQANRVTLAFGAVSGQSIATSSSASFTMNASATVKGAFVVSNNTKGGTTGTLFAAGAFTNAQTLSSGQVLKVDYTCAAASA